MVGNGKESLFQRLGGNPMSAIELIKKTIDTILHVFRIRPYKPRVQVRRQTDCLGTEYGGYCFCPDGISNESIVYSFGVGEDISFDLALIKRFGLKVYAFDPTIKSVQWIKKQDIPEQFEFLDMGVYDYDGVAFFHFPENPDFVSHSVVKNQIVQQSGVELPVYKLSTIMNKLNHTKIDVVKMDIEGAEYAVIKDLLNDDIQVQQILVEFHHRFESTGSEKTKEIISLLNKNEYKLFSVSQDGTVCGFVRMPA